MERTLSVFHGNWKLGPGKCCGAHAITPAWCPHFAGGKGAPGPVLVAMEVTSSEFLHPKAECSTEQKWWRGGKSVRVFHFLPRSND